ncbi:MAG: heme o synthase [Pseudomonadota bacterium]
MTVVTTDHLPEYGDIRDYFALLKPRVMSLVVFTAAIAIWVAPGNIHPFLAFASILFIALGAGASGALNMWWDADIDQIMKRTSKRPVPAGKVTANNALIIGLWLSGLSVAMLGLTSNWMAAGLLAFTIFFYAVIYSMWLKRSTPQNIVIGGAAGAFPPMIGWAVVTGDVTIASIGMFMLIFMWTPPHFWALALFMNEDYTKAGVPMLTVTHGKKETRKQILIYTVLLAPLSIAIGFTEIGGPFYLVASLILNAMFVAHAIKLYRRSEQMAEDDTFAAEKSMFKFSLSYLFLLFAAIGVEAFINLPAWPQVL